MKAHAPSRTAEYMALFRASERAEPDQARVLIDPLALQMLPRSFALPARAFAWGPLGSVLNTYIDRRSPGARTSGIARTRLIDDWVTNAVPPIDQLVLLGAGFDTRAWRLPALASVRVFEVDHPDTGAAKRARLAAAGVTSRHVAYVPVDFERDDFRAALHSVGFEADRPAFVVWEGVSQYLQSSAVHDVLRWAGSLAPGTRFVFTYVHQGVIDGSRRFLGAAEAMKAVNASGEPWKFGLLPEKVPALLRTLGLHVLEDLGADEYRRLIMGERARTVQGYAFYRVVIAEVTRA